LPPGSAHLPHTGSPKPKPLNERNVPMSTKLETIAFHFRRMFAGTPDISSHTPGLEPYRAMTIADLLTGLMDEDLMENVFCKRVLVERMEAGNADDIFNFVKDAIMRGHARHSMH
jgi:hypothetical protein